MSKIITTGINGLVGSKFKQLFSSQYEIINLGLDEATPTDITNLANVEAIVAQNSDAIAVVHLAAYTDVNGAFAQTDDQNGLAYQVNVLGTQNIVATARNYHKYLIAVSTAYVFDGAKETPYTETDPPRAIEWYGQTKLLAEESIISAPDLKSSILRIDQPFQNETAAKQDTLHRIITGLEANTLYPQFTDHYFGPTYLDDFAKIIDFFLRKQLTGIYHCSSGESWTDYDFARLIARKYNFDPDLVQKGSLEKYLATTNRPYQVNTALNIDKLKSVLDFDLTPIDVAIKGL
ncbi:SDR family oxidoreductase [Microgenomates group bacterium]|nr:SDR family oxidoreductase [Microgenomates group bacterium]